MELAERTTADLSGVSREHLAGVLEELARNLARPR